MGRVLRRRLIALSLALALVAGAGIGITVAVRALIGTARVTPTCTLGTGSGAVELDPEQAADAATVAAVAVRRGLPNHAVTIALATALQESKLYNLNYGDRDSLGIFQQRPSQGWGSPTQLQDPAYAAGAFYSHLVQVSGWHTLTVSAAAQRVQHSADGSAYAQWEEEARALARALTGEVDAGLACRFDGNPPPRPAPLLTAVRTQLGSRWNARDLGRSHDWATAEWIVAHAYAYGVLEVQVRGMRWTSATGHWRAAATGQAPTTYRLSVGQKS
jgi:hypothetical protein